MASLETNVGAMNCGNCAIASFSLQLRTASGLLKLRAPRFSASSSRRSEEHTSELQSLMRLSYAGFCLKKKNKPNNRQKHSSTPKTIRRTQDKTTRKQLSKTPHSPSYTTTNNTNNRHPS